MCTIPHSNTDCGFQFSSLLFRYINHFRSYSRTFPSYFRICAKTSKISTFNFSESKFFDIRFCLILLPCRFTHGWMQYGGPSIAGSLWASSEDPHDGDGIWGRSGNAFSHVWFSLLLILFGLRLILFEGVNLLFCLAIGLGAYKEGMRGPGEVRGHDK